MSNNTVRLPKYGKNALRPNPDAASVARYGGDPDVHASLAFAVDTIMVGDFGGWDADALRTNGLPSTKTEKPGKRRGKK